MSDLSDYSRRARMVSGLSQEEFADLCGVSVSSVSRWETGKSKPSPEMVNTLRRIITGIRPFTSPQYVQASPTWKVMVSLHDLHHVMIVSNGLLKAKGMDRKMWDATPRSGHYADIVRQLNANKDFQERRVAFIETCHRARVGWCESIANISYAGEAMLWEMMPTRRRDFSLKITTLDEIRQMEPHRITLFPDEVDSRLRA
ncbi:MAG: helix-turn-helix transcriptional regulator [Pseudomonadota bacterium]